MAETVNALVWSEGSAAEEAPEAYPNDVNVAIAAHLNEHDDIVARTASLSEDHDGVSESRLAWADALLWWGHRYHADVSEGTVERIERHADWHDLGFVALHSAHYSRPFTNLLDASGDLGAVRTVPEAESVEVRAPDHPVAEGIEDFTVPRVEMYGEPFDVPDPDTLVFHSTFEEGGEFRSGLAYEIDGARIFYFRPGHEEFRIYHQPEVRRVLENATRWVAGET